MNVVAAVQAGIINSRIVSFLCSKELNALGLTGIDNNLFVDQWDPYNQDTLLSRQEALSLVLKHMDKVKAETLKLSTRIMSVPGYKFRMTDGIITNFHQPASTLLLLIAAFTGEEWKSIYNYALNNNYRFLSYGDSSLLLR